RHQQVGQVGVSPHQEPRPADADPAAAALRAADTDGCLGHAVGADRTAAIRAADARLAAGVAVAGCHALTIRSRDCYQIPLSAPPSTGSTQPDTYAAGTEQRKATAAATSSAVPIRPAGIASMSRTRAASGSGWRAANSRARGVSILPGAT